MAVNGIRIDDRLIHGQVCSLWIPYYKPDRIIIIDDEIATNDTRKAILKFGCPANVKLAIISVASAFDKLSKGLDEGIKVMILCNRPEPLFKLYDMGYKFDEISIGNMSRKEGALQFRTTVYTTKDDRFYFDELQKRGVKIYCQMSPQDSKVDYTNNER